MNGRVIILGGGISGLSAGWKLAHNGIPVDILEIDGRVGGLACTVRKHDYFLDIGPHSFFSEDIEILNTVLKLFDNEMKSKPRRVKFYYKGKYLNYPLTVFNILFQMGISSGMRVGLSFLKSKIILKKHVAFEKKDESVEDWAIANFGKRLYQTFFKPYTEQFWKIPCAELSSCSIPTHTRMNFINTCRSLLHRKITKKGDSLIEREALPTYYPNSGFGEIAERIAKTITKMEGNIHLACEATEIFRLPNGRTKVVYKEAGKKKVIEGAYVISTIPLNLLVRMLRPVPPKEILGSTEKLDYQSLIVLGMVTEKQDILNCHYMYMINRPYNRISEMNKFSPATSPPKDNILAVEFTCRRNSAIWKATKEELFDMSIGTLTEDGFLSKEDVKELLVIKTPHAYPVYRKDYAEHLKKLLDYARKYKRIITLGRTGEFIYMDVDKCMRRAFDCADDLLIKYRKEKTIKSVGIEIL